ncbi:uncharacterized protein LOC134821598 [Bolinopsis microptera]|uniref:uncharacterized protein LOC134821598 n=1 Tax=Bolinopsis microptera TaxID=2820187 RepID=UPI0030796E93
MGEPCSHETKEKIDDPDTSAEAPPPKWDIKSYSPNKKRILFGAMCIFHIFTFVFFNLPYSYLPVYNENREISTYWTGLILGAASFGLMLSCVFIAPIVITKFSTRFVLSGCFSGLATSVFLFAMLDFIKNSSAYETFALIVRFIAGIFGGIINVATFAAYVAIYPEYVATVTSIGEAVLNGAVAFGPFLGGVLYDASGYIAAAMVPGSLILISAVPAFFLPSLNSKKRRTGEDPSSLKTILDPWVLFPLWHLASSQILITYHMPLLSTYVKEAFDAGVVWSGTALLVSTAVICVSSPFLGLLIDKFGPCKMMIASSMSLPLVYVFVGPLPLLRFVTPSRTQLLLSLAFLGLAVPMACISALPVMFQVYQSRNQGKLPILVINTLVSLYCAAYPLGIFIGTITSGFIEPYASFGWSTGTLGLIYIAQSLLCIAYCINVMRSSSKNADVEQEGYVMDNPVADSNM